MLKSLVSVAALFALAGVVSAATLEPVNESAREPQLAELLASLVKACDAGDLKPIEAVLAPDVLGENDADAKDGPEAFKAYWSLGAPDSYFCSEFTAAIKLGGAFRVDPDAPPTYDTPYVMANWPDDVDPFSHIAAIGPATALYAKAIDGADIVADVTHQMLEIVDDNAVPEGWAHVKADGGKEGFVKSPETRSYFQPYARFEKRGEAWLLTVFLSPKG
jgi:hypothetical protein